MTGLIAFSSNLHSGQECHRDAQEGIDLFVGHIDLNSGLVTDVRLVDSEPGHQWFPALSPDGTSLAYNESRDDRERIVLVNLATFEKRVLVDGGRYPAFSSDGRVLYYSLRPIGFIYAYDLGSGQTTEIRTAHPSGDPFPVGERFLVYHSRPASSGQAFPVVYDLHTGQETDFRCPGCGHLVGNLAGDKVAGSHHSQPHLWVSCFDEGAGRWSPFELLVDEAQTRQAVLNTDLAQASGVILSYTSWPLEERLVLTVQAVEPQSNGNLLRTTAAKLFVVDIGGDQPRFIPVTLADYADVPFDIQTLGSDVLPGRGMEGIGGTAYALQAGEPASRPGRQPLLYLMYNVRNKDPDFPGSANYVEDRLAYVEYRRGILKLTRYFEEQGIPWNFQCDWNFLEGVLRYEVREPDADLLAETEGLNIVQYLARHGVEVAPHSHESYGYNYADVAYLIRQTGVEPAPVVGGHVYLPGEGFQNWPRFSDGIHGQKYGAQAFWQPTILTGSATYLHQDEPMITGVWRPKSVEDFLQHDPHGALVSIGEWGPTSASILRLLDDIRDGALPQDKMYTAALGINSYALGEEDYFQHLIKESVEPFLQLHAEGQIEFMHYADVLKVWQERFNAEGFVHYVY
jgi:hypothetical protein